MVAVQGVLSVEGGGDWQQVLVSLDPRELPLQTVGPAIVPHKLSPKIAAVSSDQSWTGLLGAEAPLARPKGAQHSDGELSVIHRLCFLVEPEVSFVI